MSEAQGADQASPSLQDRAAPHGPAFAYVEGWIFDLDNSPYPHSCNLIDLRMGAHRCKGGPKATP